MSCPRIYERDTDALFLNYLRCKPEMVDEFARLVMGRRPLGANDIKGQVRHVLDPGSIDIRVNFKNGPVFLIENKIDAPYSITRDGHGQPQRYQRSITKLRQAGTDAFSVLLAPLKYIKGSRLANLFDSRITYEDLRGVFEGKDRAVLEAAILQAEIPYEPLANIRTCEFFAATRQLIAERFSDLVMKREPNIGSVRPNGAHTVYFDVRHTLHKHKGVPQPRMSLQCRDKAESSASVKIMLQDRASLAGRLITPTDLDDIGGYLRSASRSLGIVIDTPRLETQKPFAEQADDIVEGLEATLRLQRWWNENGDLLRQWSMI